jgi:uncharacterized protein YfaT (DUF1175 family)
VSKTIKKSLRLTEKENLQLEENLQKHNLTFSNYARAKILNQKIKSKITNDLIYEVSKIGNNLNQIAKYVNTEKALDFRVLEKLIEIENI